MTDCGIRPATSAEAEWLQDYIHKSNNHAGQPSVNAARLANEQAETTTRSEERSDDDDDDDSEGVNSALGSKRNSLALSGDVKGTVFPAGYERQNPDRRYSSLASASEPASTWYLPSSGVHSPASGSRQRVTCSVPITSIRQFGAVPCVPAIFICSSVPALP